MRQSQNSSKLFLWRYPSRNRHSLAARPLPSKSFSEHCWHLRMELASAMQAKRSSFRLSWLNCYSDHARHSVRLHHVARFKPNLPGLPMDLPQLGEPTKLPKAQMLCCAPVIFNGAWSRFSAGNCGGVLETSALHSTGRTLQNCVPFWTPRSKKEHPEKANNAREGSQKHAL